MILRLRSLVSSPPNLVCSGGDESSSFVRRAAAPAAACDTSVLLALGLNQVSGTGSPTGSMLHAHTTWPSCMT